jgi:hypothetical protein
MCQMCGPSWEELERIYDAEDAYSETQSPNAPRSQFENFLPDFPANEGSGPPDAPIRVCCAFSDQNIKIYKRQPKKLSPCLLRALRYHYLCCTRCARRLVGLKASSRRRLARMLGWQ